MRWLLRAILSPSYELTMFSNGIQAYSWLAEGNLPSLIISDLNMPSLSGGEFLAEIRVSALFRDIPVIILSADENPAKRRQCLELGVFKFIEIPFQPEALLNDVAEATSLSPVYP